MTRVTGVVSELLELLVSLRSQIGFSVCWFLGVVALQWLRGLCQLG
jgi:hypothetical protein